MAKKPPKSKYSAPTPVDPSQDTFFGAPPGPDEVFSPDTLWSPIDLPAHVAKKQAASAKDAQRKAKIKAAKKPRTADEIAADAWASADEPNKPQPQSVTIIPAPKGHAAVVEVLPHGGTQTIAPAQGGVEAIKITTDPSPDALTVEHSGKFSTPRAAPRIRFGGGGAAPQSPPPTPASPPPTPMPSPVSSGSTIIPKVTVEPSKVTSPTSEPVKDEPAPPITVVTPPPPKDRSGERGAIDIDPAVIKGVDTARREGFLFARKLKEKLFGSRESTPEETENRKALIGLSSRFRNTYDIVQQNQALFTELAKDNAQVKAMLLRMDDKRMKGVVEKLVEGQQIFPEESELLIDNWESILQQLETIGISLDVNFGELFKSAKQIVNDSRVDFNTRRALIANITKVATQKGVESTALDELKDINLQQVNFTKEQTDNINALLERLEPDVKDIKMQGTMREIGDKLGAFVANQKQTNELLESQVDGQMSLKDKLKNFGMGALQDQRKRGLVSTAFSAMGLGGMDDLLETGLDLKDSFSSGGKGAAKGGGRLGRMGQGIGRILRRVPGLGKLMPAVEGGIAAAPKTGMLGKLGGWLSGGASKIGGLLPKIGGAAAEAATGIPGISKVGGIASKVGGILPSMGLSAGIGGKILGGAGKVLGKLALPIAIATSAYDAYKGVTEAENVTGKKDNGLLNKAGAGFASVISGLSFGVFDKKKVYEGLAVVGDSMTSTIDGVTTIAADGKMSTLEKMKKSLSYLWDTISTFGSDLGSWVASWFGKDKKPGDMPGTGDVDEIAKAQIKKEEGLNLNQYKDATGKSVGYGHFVKPGENIPEKITKEDAENLFEQDYGEMKQFVMNRLKADLAPQQVASLISLGYNAGPGAVSKVIDKLNAGDASGAMETMASINKSRTKAGGVATVNPALVSRRAREVEQFKSAPMPAQKTKATAQPSPAVLDARAKDVAKRELEQSRAQRSKMAQSIPLLIPGAQNQSRASQGAPRLTGIHDSDLILATSGIMFGS